MESEYWEPDELTLVCRHLEAEVMRQPRTVGRLLKHEAFHQLSMAVVLSSAKGVTRMYDPKFLKQGDITFHQMRKLEIDRSTSRSLRAHPARLGISARFHP